MLYKTSSLIALMIGTGIVLGGFVPETITVSARTSRDAAVRTFSYVQPVSFVATEIFSLHKKEEEQSVGEQEQFVSEFSRASQNQPVAQVPFYSQFEDISDPGWKKVGCGIASLAMLIEYYEPEKVDVDELLHEGIARNAYLDDAGWIHAGLISLSERYGLGGATHDMRDSSMATAFLELENELEEGPVMASVHYTFDPQNPIPHLVVVNGVRDGKVYYNDPSEPSGGNAISITKFQSAWKKRYIEIRPVS